jgi:hypothetical protein
MLARQNKVGVCSQTAGQLSVWLPFPGHEEVNELLKLAPQMRSVMELCRHCRCLHLGKHTDLVLRKRVRAAWLFGGKCSPHLKVAVSEISGRGQTILTEVLGGFP